MYIYIYIIVYGFASHASRSFRRVQTQLLCTAEKHFGGGMGVGVFFFSGIFVSYGPWDSQDPKEYWWGEKVMGYGTQTELIHHNKGFMGGCSSIFAYLF